MDRKALGSIHLHLAQSVQYNIIKVKATEELVQTLERLYENPSTSNKVFLMKSLFIMKIVEGGFVANHLDEFNIVTNQLPSINFNFDEEVRVLLILCSFLESWNSLVMAISNYISGTNTLKFDDVIDLF